MKNHLVIFFYLHTFLHTLLRDVVGGAHKIRIEFIFIKIREKVGYRKAVCTKVGQILSLVVGKHRARPAPTLIAATRVRQPIARPPCGALIHLPRV